MIIIPQSTFEFIWNNKIELTKAIRDWEYTGSQPYFDSKLFHNYLLFISQYDGITATAKLRLFYPDRSCNRIVYDSNDNRVENIPIKLIDGINYRFTSSLESSVPGNQSKQRKYLYYYHHPSKTYTFDDLITFTRFVTKHNGLKTGITYNTIYSIFYPEAKKEPIYKNPIGSPEHWLQETIKREPKISKYLTHK